VLVAAGTASSAHASLLWDFTFGVIGGGDTASGTLTTNSLSSGTYAITGITGTFDGQTITGLAPTGQGPYNISDNLLYPGPGFLDLGGLAFTFSGGGPETIYGAEGCCTFFDYSTANDASGSANFSASLVPEPASAGVFAMGMAALGLLRRRRTVAPSVVPAPGVAAG
jgi:hypothetical protein